MPERAVPKFCNIGQDQLDPRKDDKKSEIEWYKGFRGMASSLKLIY